MKHLTRTLGLLAGVGLLAAGCVNMAGANLSNIGNGNSVKTGDIGSGNTIKDNGNNNNNNNGGPTNGGNKGPKLSSISLNRSAFVLRRLRPGVDVNQIFNDESRSEPYYPGKPSPTPGPTFVDYPGEVKDLTVEATGHDAGGGSFRIDRHDGQFGWELPAGVQIVNVNKPNYNGLPFALVANSDAASGSFELKVRWNGDPKIFATASVEVLDQGAAKVVID